MAQGEYEYTKSYVRRTFSSPMKDAIKAFREIHGEVAYDPEDPKTRALRDAIDKLDNVVKDH